MFICFARRQVTKPWLGDGGKSAKTNRNFYHIFLGTALFFVWNLALSFMIIPPCVRNFHPWLHWRWKSDFPTHLCVWVFVVLWNLQYSWQPGCTARCPCGRGNPPSSYRPRPASPRSAPGWPSASEAAGRARRGEGASSASAATTTPPSSAFRLTEITDTQAHILNTCRRKECTTAEQPFSRIIHWIFCICHHLPRD